MGGGGGVGVGRPWGFIGGPWGVPGGALGVPMVSPCHEGVTKGVKKMGKMG